MRRLLRHPRGGLVGPLGAACILAAFQAPLVEVAFSQPVPQIEEIATGFSSPLFVTHAGDGSGRLFVVQQRGRIRIIDAGGNIPPTDFLDLSGTGLNLVSSSGGEQGLLGLAFHPDYPSNGRFYVSYTRRTDGANTVSQFTVSADPNVADAASEQMIFGPVTQPQGNHNGGHIAFSPLDGFLYFGIGDGGGGGDTGTGHTPGIGNSQDTSNLLGKILRLDLDSAFPFAIPPDNPFVGVAGASDEIYAYGLRNPWRFTFDRGPGHRLFCGDVGQNLFEEIDIINLGDNLGWRRMEGFECFNPSTGCQTGSLVLPIHAYSHESGRCSVTGGYVYRGPSYPALDGLYFYADYCTGEIWTLEGTEPGVFSNVFRHDAPTSISSFGEDEEGELYVCGYGNGRIYRIIDANQPPVQDIELSLDEIDFGTVEISAESIPRVFEIANRGDEDLEIASITLSAGDLSQFVFDPASPLGSTLAPMQSRDVALKFVPTSTGLMQATVTILSNDPDSPSSVVILSGTGIIPPLSVNNWIFY